MKWVQQYHQTLQYTFFAPLSKTMGLIWYVKATVYCLLNSLLSILYIYVFLLIFMYRMNLKYRITCVQLRGVQDVLNEMHRNGDECRMFNLRLAVYISDVSFFCFFPFPYICNINIYIARISCLRFCFFWLFVLCFIEGVVWKM